MTVSPSRLGQEDSACPGPDLQSKEGHGEGQMQGRKGREARRGGAISRSGAVDTEGKGNGGGHHTVRAGPEGRGLDRQAPWTGKLLTKAGRA